MTSSVSSTERSRASGDSAFQPWHFYMLLSLAGATWAVIEARHTHPAALLLLSAAVMSAGLVATAMHQALAGFFSRDRETAEPPSERRRAFLDQEKALVLRSIKELEFDRAMGKIGDADFSELSSRLRARAMEILTELDRPIETPRQDAPPARPEGRGKPRSQGIGCAQCQTVNEPDARFCKNCGARLS